jgi:hypothetical protein
VGGCVQARLAALKRVVTEQQTKKSSGPGDGFDVRATGIFLFFFCLFVFKCFFLILATALRTLG